jgi:hypothetical protein
VQSYIRSQCPLCIQLQVSTHSPVSGEAVQYTLQISRVVRQAPPTPSIRALRLQHLLLDPARLERLCGSYTIVHDLDCVQVSRVSCEAVIAESCRCTESCRAFYRVHRGTRRPGAAWS